MGAWHRVSGTFGYMRGFEASPFCVLCASASAAPAFQLSSGFRFSIPECVGFTGFLTSQQRPPLLRLVIVFF